MLEAFPGFQLLRRSTSGHSRGYPGAGWSGHGNFSIGSLYTSDDIHLRQEKKSAHKKLPDRGGGPVEAGGGGGYRGGDMT